jgi:hypothetical protein
MVAMTATLHDVSLARERRDGEAVGQRLAEDRQVRRQSVHRLSAK